MIIIEKFLPEDLDNCYKMIQKLALYEGEDSNSIVPLEEFKKFLFSEVPIYNILTAKKNNKVIGIATYYYRYSTWKGKHIHLEDLFIEEDFRHHGIGKQLLDKLISTAKDEKLKRIEWEVRHNNEKAKKFYQKIGADIVENWQICRLELD